MRAAGRTVTVTEIDSRLGDEPGRRREPGAPEADGGTDGARYVDRPDAEDSGAAVDALFARLRASHTVDPAPGEPFLRASRLRGRPEAGSGAAEEAVADAAEGRPGRAERPDPEPEKPGEARAGDPQPDEPEAEAGPPAPNTGRPEPRRPRDRGGPEPAPGPSRSPDDVLRAERAEILEPLTRDLGRRAKRALQDQQNELLDKIRTIKGKVEATEVLPTAEAQDAAWAPVLDEPLSSAYPCVLGR